jgi:hypothetical protein
MTGIGALLGGVGLFLGGVAAIWWVSMQEDDRKAAKKERNKPADD